MAKALPPAPVPADRRNGGPEELRRLRRQLREVERQLERREAELALLQNSHSFKLTAPLRWLRRQLLRDRMTGPSIDALLSQEDRLPPAVRAFPARLVRHEPPNRLNDSHRPLRLDEAIQPLIPVPVKDGSLREPVSLFEYRYYGDQAQPARLATVASLEFRQELSFDVAVLPLHADRWAEQLAAGRVQILLLDGAWEPEQGWGAGFGGSPASQRRLEPLLDHCRAQSIPVVLWLREDADQLERLQWLVPRVTRVYAVDRAGEQWLGANFPGLAVGHLPVAVQPALYNPLRSHRLKDCGGALVGTALLDGWWGLSTGLGSNPLLGAFGQRLRVVDTDGDYSWARLQDSGAFAPLALGSITPLEKSALLRCGSAELFLAHAGGSSWRQSTQMLRAAASGATILVEGVQALAPVLGTEVSPGSAVERLAALSTLAPDRARAAHVVLREVLANHCLADRLGVMFQDLGIESPWESPPMRVAHLLVTMRPELLERCLARFRADHYANRELVVVLHGDDVDVSAAQALVQGDERVRLLHARAQRTLGDCLNMAIAHTDAPFWMKIDDDDHYGPAYTQDMMLYRRAIRTPLMGKPPAFLHLAGSDELRWDPEWASHANLLHDPDEATASLVAGGTLAGTREVLETQGFSGSRRGGADSEFIERCLAAGFPLLATDAFNFARYRSGQEGFHTWRVPDATLRRRTAVLGAGETLDRHVFV